MGDSLTIGKTAATTAKATGIVAPVADPPGAASAPESSSLVLVPPSPVALVEEPRATNAIKLDASTLAKLDRLVVSYVVAIASLDINDPKFESRVADIRRS